MYLRKDALKTPEEALAYLADCLLATVESLPRSTPKSAYERHVAIAQTAVDAISRMDIRLTPGHRAGEVISGCRGSVSDWSKTNSIWIGEDRARMAAVQQSHVPIPKEDDKPVVTVLIVPAFSDQAGQCRIVAAEGKHSDALASYRRDGSMWKKVGAMNSQGRVVALSKDLQDAGLLAEMQESEPMMAGTQFFVTQKDADEQSEAPRERVHG